MSNFLQYSNETQSNIIPENEFEELTQEVFNVIASNLSRSLGPLGSSATIFDGGITEATKDGYSILSKYRFHNRYKRMIYNLIKAPCTKMNNTVGDGTTTAICLTNSLFNNYKKRKNELNNYYRLPRQFIKAWDNVIETLVSYVKDHSSKIDSNDTIYNIAYIVSNGDETISKNIANIYAQVSSPSIKEKDSPTNKSYVETIDGYDFPANLISDIFARTEDLSAKEENLAIMILDHKLEADIFENIIIPICDVLRAQNRKLLILAPSYDSYMCETLVGPFINMEQMKYGKSALMMADYKQGKLANNQLKDLSTILQTKILTKDLIDGLLKTIKTTDIDVVVEKIFEDNTYQYYRCMGYSDTALLSCINGAIFKNSKIYNDPIYKTLLNRVKLELANTKAKTSNEQKGYGGKIGELKRRLNRLNMKNFIYYIGADSLLQKQIIWDSVEDTIKCIASASKFGTVPGCQLTLIEGCKHILEEINNKIEIDENGNRTISEADVLTYVITEIIYASLLDIYTILLMGPENDGILKIISPSFTEDTTSEEIINQIRSTCEEIITTSLDQMKVFDIETLTFNDKIITSAETDIMVLTVASELIKILISGNQCIVIDAEVDESHQQPADEILGV